MWLRVRICVASPSKHSHIGQEHVESVRKPKTRKRLKPIEEDEVPIPLGTWYGYGNEERDLGALVRLQER